MQDQLRKADELDPDVVTTERDAHGEQLPRDAAGNGELRRDRSARNPAASGQTTHPDDGQVPGSPVHTEPASDAARSPMSRSAPMNPAATSPATSDRSSAD